MNSRFELDDEANTSRFVDPESLDATEQYFAATLEPTKASANQRFVVESNHAEPSQRGVGGIESSVIGPPEIQSHAKLSDLPESVSPVSPDLILQQDTDSWRREVAAKVNRYRARKPRPPRYPSLQLKFEPRESSRKDSVRNESEFSDSQDYSTHNRQAVAVQHASVVPEAIPLEGRQPFIQAFSLHVPETARILEFPRSLVLPGVLDELAEPVSDKPRILDVPEHAPPAPALGGISIEPVEPPVEEKRPGIDIPLQSAVMSRRIWAASIDAFLVVLASAMFSYVFFRVTSAIPPVREGVVTALLLTGLFWSAYQYLLLVHTGTTPGLRLAKLQLRRFDGSAVPRNGRRWRVLASFLSGVSLGIGYAWCFLDEDQLCWHDRITHTYMAPRGATLSNLPE